MAKNYNSNQLISYLYNECDLLDKILVETQLETEEALAAEFTMLQEMTYFLADEMPKKQSPSRASVELIEMLGSLNSNSLQSNI